MRSAEEKLRLNDCTLDAANNRYAATLICRVCSDIGRIAMRQYA